MDIIAKNTSRSIYNSAQIATDSNIKRKKFRIVYTAKPEKDNISNIIPTFNALTISRGVFYSPRDIAKPYLVNMAAENPDLWLNYFCGYPELEFPLLIRTTVEIIRLNDISFSQFRPGVDRNPIGVNYDKVNNYLKIYLKKILPGRPVVYRFGTLKGRYKDDFIGNKVKEIVNKSIGFRKINNKDRINKILLFYFSFPAKIADYYLPRYENITIDKFPFNSYVINEMSKKKILQISCYLNNIARTMLNSGLKVKPVIKIIGHADERGSTAYNVKLGFLRAKAVKKAISTLIKKNKFDSYLNFKILSKGEVDPLIKYPRSEKDFAINRRVEIYFDSKYLNKENTKQSNIEDKLNKKLNRGIKVLTNKSLLKLIGIDASKRNYSIALNLQKVFRILLKNKDFDDRFIDFNVAKHKNEWQRISEIPLESRITRLRHILLWDYHFYDSVSDLEYLRAIIKLRSNIMNIQDVIHYVGKDGESTPYIIKKIHDWFKYEIEPKKEKNIYYYL